MKVKNPLFPIRLSVENLQQAKSNPEVFEQIFSECTDTVIEEVDRIGKLIDEFHQFARMPKPQRKWNQLNDIVRSVLTLYTGRHIPDLEQENEIAPMSSEHVNSVLQDSTEKFWLENISKIKVRTELASLPRLLVDPEHIAQALGNLLKNAMKLCLKADCLRLKPISRQTHRKRIQTRHRGNHATTKNREKETKKIWTPMHGFTGNSRYGSRYVPGDCDESLCAVLHDKVRDEW